MPLFISKLTDSSLAIGLAAMVAQGGWFLPQILTSRWVEQQPRKKLIAVNVGFFAERLPVLFLAGAALLAKSSPQLALVAFLLAYAWRSLGGGGRWRRLARPDRQDYSGGPARPLLGVEHHPGAGGEHRRLGAGCLAAGSIELSVQFCRHLAAFRAAQRPELDLLESHARTAPTQTAGPAGPGQDFSAPGRDCQKTTAFSGAF